jgi:hypothetical protein
MRHLRPRQPFSKVLAELTAKLAGLEWSVRYLAAPTTGSSSVCRHYPLGSQIERQRQTRTFCLPPHPNSTQTSRFPFHRRGFGGLPSRTDRTHQQRTLLIPHLPPSAPRKEDDSAAACTRLDSAFNRDFPSSRPLGLESSQISPVASNATHPGKR